MQNPAESKQSWINLGLSKDRLSLSALGICLAAGNASVLAEQVLGTPKGREGGGENQFICVVPPGLVPVTSNRAGATAI